MVLVSITASLRIKGFGIMSFPLAGTENKPLLKRSKEDSKIWNLVRWSLETENSMSNEALSET